MAAINLGNVRGATGATGATGAKGDKGDTGATGATGAGVPSGGSVGNLLINSAPGVGAWATDNKVVGAASSTDNAIARYDGATGKLLQDSGVIITDGAVLQSGATGATTGSVLLQANYNNYPAQAIGTEYSSGGIGFLQYMYQVGSESWKSYFHAGNIGRAALMLDVSGLRLLTAPAQNVDPGVVLTTQPTVKFQVTANGDVRIYGQIIDNAGSSGADGQVLKKVGGLVLWSNP